MKKSARVLVNTRVLSSPLTGVQRYTLDLELLSRFGGQVETVAPGKGYAGMRGHLWEQLVLPHYAKGKLLCCFSVPRTRGHYR